MLFVDIVGSTTLAATRPPEEVVDLLNRFFAVVVDVVAEHGGLVNKFEGDAALAVFGAPARGRRPRPARRWRRAGPWPSGCASEVPELEAGIGIAAGPAVAGNIGEERRYEYTVIGDPVNEAARLSELAKDGARAAAWPRPRRSSAPARRRRAHWELGDEVELRGRTRADAARDARRGLAARRPRARAGGGSGRAARRSAASRR